MILYLRLCYRRAKAPDVDDFRAKKRQPAAARHDLAADLVRVPTLRTLKAKKAKADPSSLVPRDDTKATAKATRARGSKVLGEMEQPITGVVEPKKVPFREKSTYRMSFSRSRVITAFFRHKRGAGRVVT